MKKLICVIFAVAILSKVSVPVIAGSIPEDLLHSDEAQVFFAEVVYYHPDKENPDIELSPTHVVKGDVKTGGKLIYYNPNPIGDFKVKEGRIYLFTYFDEHNPTDIFDVTSYDTATLKLKNVEGDMWKRFETYLNKGEYEEAELKRAGKGEVLEKLKNAGVLADLFVLDRENIEKIAAIYPGEGDPAGCYLDKDKFFDIAETIRLLPNSWDITYSAENNAGIVIMPQEVGDDQYNVWIDQHGNVGSQFFVSSTRNPEYKMSRADYMKLYAFLPAEATAHFPQENPMKNHIMIMIGASVLVFAIAFLTGFAIKKKRLKDNVKN